MSVWRLVALSVGILFLPIITFAQAPGTARIRGRVVAADTGTPLRRAQVRISAAELRVNRSVNTDAEGIYEFTELPAGRYNIFVTRSGFVSLQFGQRRPFESGRPLDVGHAQIVEEIDFALPRGGVIAGRVTDELGEPLAGVRMQAMRYQYLPSGQRQLVPVAGMGMAYGITTNDLGEFRLYSLMPGTYIVSAAPSEMGMMMASPGGPASAPNDGHGITYYPGTINVDEAQGITVGIAEVASASFALVPQRMTRVSGLVRDSQGKPVAANLMLRTQSESSMMMRGATMAGPDGRFSLANVPPGEHFIEVAPRMHAASAETTSSSPSFRPVSLRVGSVAPSGRFAPTPMACIESGTCRRATTSRRLFRLCRSRSMMNGTRHSWKGSGRGNRL